MTQCWPMPHQVYSVFRDIEAAGTHNQYITAEVARKAWLMRTGSLPTAVFLTFGLSGIIPAVHYTFIEGFDYAITRASMGWLILMGALYVIGALLYAVRVPERFFPGKCDLWVSTGWWW